MHGADLNYLCISPWLGAYRDTYLRACSWYYKTANVRHAWLYDCAFRETRKKLKQSYDDGDFGSKKYKRGYGVAPVMKHHNSEHW